MTRGPVPKRSTERRRTNAPEVPIVTAPAAATSEAPPLRDGSSVAAQDWYGALAASGQSRFYEPSDWATAQLVAVAIDTYVENPTAMMLRTILTASSALLATEGDRRRLRIELVRQAGDPDEDAAVAALDDYRTRLAT